MDKLQYQKKMGLKREGGGKRKHKIDKGIEGRRKIKHNRKGKQRGKKKQKENKVNERTTNQRRKR